MCYDKYRDIEFPNGSTSIHESDLRHYLCFGHEHGPKEGGDHPFHDPEILVVDDLIRDLERYVGHHNLTPEQIRAIAWWTGFKCSRYYNCQHNLVAGLLEILATNWKDAS